MGNNGRLIIAAAAAYFSGQRYCVNTNYNVPGAKGIVVDIVAVLPRLKELKPRLKKGFAPSGILAYMVDRGWVPFNELVELTGYQIGFIGEVLTEAAENGWIEIDVSSKVAKCRIKNYRNSAKSCILAFMGAEELEKKIEIFKSQQKKCTAGYFIFPYALDHNTIDLIASTGAGIMQYYESHGIFQELIPGEQMDIEDARGFAMLTEKLLHDDIWIKTGEII